jgi:purine nucleoside permease
MLFRNLSRFSLALALAAAAHAEILKPRVVIVAMFEVGADSGDTPGELQYWVEREHLDRIVPLPAASHAVRANADGSVIAILTGAGNINATATLMALGLDPQFDLRQSYFLVAGIAGIDPADGSIGSAVWADYVVDGDLAHEIDAREIPADWTTGYVPLGKKKPYESPPLAADYAAGQFYQLNPGLLRWAFDLTKDTPLDDNPQMKARRAAYTGFPKAQQPPTVMIGANLAASTYWHGKLLNRWANDWVNYYTRGQGNYVTTAMEDSGTLRALTNLDRAGKADVRRVLVLRTASNFDMQWPGGTAAESMNGESVGIYSAYLPALEAAHRVGSRVVHELAAHWERYASAPPAAPAR